MSHIEAEVQLMQCLFGVHSSPLPVDIDRLTQGARRLPGSAIDPACWTLAPRNLRVFALPPLVLRLTYYAARYSLCRMIRSFRCKDTEKLFGGRCPACFRAFQAAAERKLTQLHNAATLDFLRSPPGNRLEALSGDRVGCYSIRINAQWRLCFAWREGDAYEVEIVDYH